MAGDLKKDLAALLKKAQRSLHDAELLLEHESPDFAAARAYYAAFYAVEAALLARGLTVSSHAQTIGAFNRHFLKTGDLPAEWSRDLERLFQERQSGDYDYEMPLSADDAQEDIRLAGTIVNSIAAFLAAQGYLP